MTEGQRVKKEGESHSVSHEQQILLLSTLIQLEQVARKAKNSAEFSFVVADQWQRHGIGSILMDYCLAVAREIGIKTLWMEIMKDNSRMIKFGQKYHFKRLPVDEGGDMVEMVLELR